MPENGYEQRKTLRKYRRVQVVAFFVVLYVLAVVGLMIPLRPTESENEKRELTPFPAFTLASFWDGSFFKGIDLWFSDTFPFRETLISWNTNLWSLSGIHTNTVHGEVKPGDDIPTLGEVHGTTPAASTETTTTTATTHTTRTTTTTTKADGGDTPQEKGEKAGPILQVGNKGYEYYNFVRSESDRYIHLMDAVGDKLAGQAQVYDIVVPNSMGVMLSDEYKQREKITTSDQKAAIDYMAGSIKSGNVKSVKIFDALRAHWKEYIYFRTDHHWTATGAYYAYEQFAKVKGFTPEPLNGYETHSYEGFLGTFYAGTGKSAAMGKTPDTVVTYTPKATNSMQFTQSNGQVINWNVVMDVSDYGAANKYSAFIGGDNPYAVIHNPTLKNGSSCVVVKESYGNAFVPFLVDHYQTVHVIDYRYYEQNLIDFVKKNKVQDVIFINNIMATSTGQRIDDMCKLAGVS